MSYGLDEACSAGEGYEWASSNASTNAATILSYINEHNQQIFAFEFGNEINNVAPRPCNQTAAAQAAGHIAFRAMVQQTLPQAKLIGPDTGYTDWQVWGHWKCSSSPESTIPTIASTATSTSPPVELASGLSAEGCFNWDPRNHAPRVQRYR